jgi:tRNA1Val (adenine37-N6)-methyltransferase
MRDVPADKSGDSLDALFAGAVKFYQSRRGYRCSLDAVLLAHFAALSRGASVVDLGAGNGAVTLMLALLHPAARLRGIEIQQPMVERARRSVALNRLEERVSIQWGDVRRPSAIAAPESFDAAVCNPPYRAPRSGRVSPHPEKQLARHELNGTVADFAQAARFLLRAKGRFALVYPAFRAVDALAALRRAGLEPKRLRWVHSSRGSEATLLLVEGVKGGRIELAVEPPLFIYDEHGGYGAEVEAMLRGALRR